MSRNDCQCFACKVDRARSEPVARLPLVLGAIALPLLAVGMLGFSAHAAYAAAAVAGGGLLAHVILLLLRAR